MKRRDLQCVEEVEEHGGIDVRGIDRGEKYESFESVRCMHVLIYGRDPAARYRVPT